MRAAERRQQVVACVHVRLDEVRQDLGVGLGAQLVAARLQLGAQLQVVLDDAVVDDDDVAGAVAVRVGVVVRRLAVRRPARVADAGARRRDTRPRAPARSAESLPAPLVTLDLAVVEDGDAGAVVAAILEPLQSIEQQRRRVTLARVADDAAHQRTSAVDDRRVGVSSRGR